MTISIDIAELIAQTDASKAPVRLEYVRGHAKWEASPASRHQKALQRIERSLHPIPGHPGGCGCFALADTLIRFGDPDRSIKRPDLAIFCSEPPDSDEALEIIPAAVVEVISLGYEEKDLGPDGAPFYLAYGVQDVVITDPRNGQVYHERPGCPRRMLTAPVSIDLACGCRVTVE
ncbi:Uma2 family endonuclease [Candidatus Oscillochloris fontis]|uniref:Uma2 family endonuclease n=1 Tax=Candidatus Oscillochloris fontis TaxID=2496868 RepID=UPI00101C48DC|nr:Uma2 family endonuclease [Candidatus Oscillochloris fontis]